ncbi:MAG TPA: hypothetical protein VG819_14355 [Rhizomicrobium sp.]|jgi:hypothetical protein|nr:hypothetical protein [Rhizomicrobium sp.]
MDAYGEHKISRPDYRRIAAEMEHSAAFARALGQRSTADRLRERAAAMRGDLALSLAREMDFLFRF